MPAAPLYIHKLQLKTKIDPRCYNEIPISAHIENKSKEYIDVIGNIRVTYLFYPKGTVMAYIESSNNPLKLESELDRSRILTFLGQVRDRLILILCDTHERIVSDIMNWELSQCDINKDIPVSDWMQYSGSKIQISHLDHVFRIYIKAMGKDTVCRTEESKYPKKPAIEAISDFFNPTEKIAQDISKIMGMLAILLDRKSQGGKLAD